nr:MAG TPA: hypothetical protein [Caudoviricetes sp.]
MLLFVLYCFLPACCYVASHNQFENQLHHQSLSNVIHQVITHFLYNIE